MSEGKKDTSHTIARMLRAYSLNILVSNLYNFQLVLMEAFSLKTIQILEWISQ